jgi:hypothetical protein
MFEAVTSKELFNRYDLKAFREIADIPDRAIVFAQGESTEKIIVLVFMGLDALFVGSFDPLAYAAILQDIGDGLDIELIIIKNSPMNVMLSEGYREYLN